MPNIAGLKTKNGVDYSSKVDKVTDYSLVANQEITKLSSLSSCDDSSLRSSLIEQIEDSKSYPSLTFPIPFDEDNDVLKLLVDLSLTENHYNIYSKQKNLLVLKN